jgi:hypothetical protein
MNVPRERRPTIDEIAAEIKRERKGKRARPKKRKRPKTSEILKALATLKKLHGDES